MVQTSDQDATRWRDYISHLAWERLGILQEELENVGERDIWTTLLRNSALDKQKQMNGWMDDTRTEYIFEVFSQVLVYEH